MDTKSLFQSKTFWFNMAIGTLALLQGQGVVDMLPTGAVEGIVTMGNIILRFLTKQPVHVA